MAISNDDVRHVAKLAKLAITDDEVELYTKQLRDVLQYVEILQGVDTEDVKPTNQTTGLVNIFREDEVVDTTQEERDRLLSNAPEIIDGMIAVPHSIKKFK